VELAYRDALDTVLATKESQDTMRLEPEVVIRPDDFFELFSTEPDLAGGFTNVSQFVRDQDRNVDVHVFWRDFDPAKVKQPNESAPVRDELCPVPFFEFCQFVRNSRLAWEWNFETGKWESRRATDIQPGMTLLLPKSAGG
jgi:CRISPR-associated endonuclease/helicase Cas3